METIVKTKSAVKIAVVVAVVFAAAAAIFAAGGIRIKEKRYKTMFVQCLDGTSTTINQKVCRTSSEWKKAAENFCYPKTKVASSKKRGVKKTKLMNECKTAPLSSPTSRPLSNPNAFSGLNVYRVVESAPPSNSVVVVGQKNVKVLTFRLEAQNEPIKLRNLTLSSSGPVKSSSIQNIRLFQGAYQATSSIPFASLNSASMTRVQADNSTRNDYTWTASDNILPDTIKPGAPVTVTVLVDVSSAGQAKLGDTFTFTLYSSTMTGAQSFVAVGANSGANLLVQGQDNSLKDCLTFIITPFIVRVENLLPISGSAAQAVLNNTQLGRFKVNNFGSSVVTLYQMFLNDSGTHSGSSAAYKFLYSDQNSSNYTANTAVANSNHLRFVFDNGFRIDGGAYRNTTVSLQSALGLQSGDTFQISAEPYVGSILYRVTEVDLGYDGDLDGRLTSTISGLPAVAPTSPLGMIVKR